MFFLFASSYSANALKQLKSVGFDTSKNFGTVPRRSYSEIPLIHRFVVT